MTHRAAPRGERPPGSQLQTLAFRWRNSLTSTPLVFALASSRWESEHDLAVWGLALGLASAGVSLRAWSTLHCHYGQGVRKTLATSGPYSLVRNPLYVGNILVLAGAAAASELLWLVPLVMGWAFAVYDQAIRHEERRVFQRYGREYSIYCTRVSRWLPRAVSLSLGALPAGALRAALIQSRALIALAPFAVKEWNLLGLWPGS